MGKGSSSTRCTYGTTYHNNETVEDYRARQHNEDEKTMRVKVLLLGEHTTTHTIATMTYSQSLAVALVLALVLALAPALVLVPVVHGSIFVDPLAEVAEETWSGEVMMGWGLQAGMGWGLEWYGVWGGAWSGMGYRGWGSLWTHREKLKWPPGCSGDCGGGEWLWW